MWCCIEHFYFPTDTSSLDSFIRLEYFLSINMFEQTNSSNFFSSHPHEYDEVKHFLTSLPEISFSTLQKEQLFHAFVSRLFLRVGVRWRARVRAGPGVLKKKKKEKERGKKKEKKGRTF